MSTEAAAKAGRIGGRRANPADAERYAQMVLQLQRHRSAIYADPRLSRATRVEAVKCLDALVECIEGIREQSQEIA